MSKSPGSFAVGIYSPEGRLGWGGMGGPSRPPISNNPAFRQVGDLVLRVAERRQRLVIGIAELRRRAAQRIALLAVRDRVAENREIAQRRRMHLLGEG